MPTDAGAIDAATVPEASDALDALADKSAPTKNSPLENARMTDIAAILAEFGERVGFERFHRANACQARVVSEPLR